MESKATLKPLHQVLLPPASNQMLAIELTWVWHHDPMIFSQGELHAKIFNILFVKALCFQSERDVCFSPSQRLMKWSVLTSYGRQGYKGWMACVLRDKKLNFGFVVEFFGEMNFSLIFELVSLFLEEYWIDLLRKGLDLFKSVVLRETSLIVRRGHLTIYEDTFGCHNLGAWYASDI